MVRARVAPRERKANRERLPEYHAQMSIPTPRVDSAASTLQKADGAAHRADALAQDVVRPDVRRAHSVRGKRATGDAPLTGIICEGGEISL